MGVVVVLVAGNSAETGHPEANMYPAMCGYAEPTLGYDPVSDLITVGAATWDSHRAPLSQSGPLVDVYGPGFYIHEAVPNELGGRYALTSGTSFGKFVCVLIVHLVLDHVLIICLSCSSCYCGKKIIPRIPLTWLVWLLWHF